MSDFQFFTSINLDDTINRTQIDGNIKFMVLELIQGRTDYDEKIDVYA